MKIVNCSASTNIDGNKIDHKGTSIEGILYDHIFTLIQNNKLSETEIDDILKRLDALKPEVDMIEATLKVDELLMEASKEVHTVESYRTELAVSTSSNDKKLLKTLDKLIEASKRVGRDISSVPIFLSAYNSAYGATYNANTNVINITPQGNKNNIIIHEIVHSMFDNIIRNDNDPNSVINTQLVAQMENFLALTHQDERFKTVQDEINNHLAQGNVMQAKMEFVAYVLDGRNWNVAGKGYKIGDVNRQGLRAALTKYLKNIIDLFKRLVGYDEKDNTLYSIVLDTVEAAAIQEEERLNTPLSNVGDNNSRSNTLDDAKVLLSTSIDTLLSTNDSYFTDEELEFMSKALVSSTLSIEDLTLLSSDILELTDKRQVKKKLREANLLPKASSKSLMSASLDPSTFEAYIKSIFPNANVGSAQNASLLESAITFRKSYRNSEKIEVAREIIRKLWYNYLTRAEKDSIKLQLSQYKLSDSLLPNLPRLIEYNGNSYRILPITYSGNSDFTITIEGLNPEVGTEEFIVSPTGVVSKVLDNTTIKLSNSEARIFKDIISILKYMNNPFTLGDSDFDALNALAIHYAYSDVSDPRYTSLAQLNDAIDTLTDDTKKLSDLEATFVSIRAQEFTSEEQALFRLFKADERSINNLFGKYDEKTKTFSKGLENVNRASNLLKDVLYMLTTGNVVSDRTNTYANLGSTIVIASDADLESRLLEIVTAISQIRVNGKETGKVLTAKYLLAALGEEGTKQTTFKESRLEFIYRLVLGKDIDVLDNNTIVSLGDTNEKINYSETAPQSVKRFLSIIPKDNNYYAYNYVFVNAIKLFSNNPSYVRTINSLPNGGTPKLENDVQQVLYNELFNLRIQLIEGVRDNTGKELTNVHMSTYSKTYKIIIYKGKENLSIIDMPSSEIEALLDNPEYKDQFDTYSGKNIEELSKTIKPDHSNIDLVVLNGVAKRAFILDLFRNLQNYMGSLAEKEYSFYDKRKNKYTPYKTKGYNNTISGIIRPILTETTLIDTKDGQQIALIPELDSKDLVKSLLKMIGLENHADNINKGTPKHTDLLSNANAFQDLITQFNSTITKFNNVNKVITLEQQKKLETKLEEDYDNSNTPDLLRNKLDQLLEIYASGTVKTADGNTIYTFTLSSYAQDKLKNMPSSTLAKRIKSYSLYDGFKNEYGARGFLDESVISFIERDLRDFFPGEGRKTGYHQTIINQGDKAKSLLFKVERLSDSVINKEVIDVIKHIQEKTAKRKEEGGDKLGYKGVGLMFPYMDGDVVKYKNFSENVEPESIIEFIEKEYLPYFKQYIKNANTSNYSTINKLIEGENQEEIDQTLISYIKHNIYYNHAILNEIAGELQDFKNDRDVVKRLTGSLAPGARLYTGIGGASSKFAVVSMADLKGYLNPTSDSNDSVLFNSKGKAGELRSLFESQLDTLKDFYKSQFDVTDGQAIITERRFNELQKGLGKAYKLGGVIKPVIFNGKQYNKYSAFVLTEGLAETLGIKELYSAMMKAEEEVSSKFSSDKTGPITVEFHFNTTNKKGLYKINDKFQASTDIKLSSLVTENKEESLIAPDKVRIIDTEHYRLQLNPMAGKKSTTFPTQPAYFLASSPVAYKRATTAWANLVKMELDKLRLELDTPEKIKSFIRKNLSKDDLVTSILIDAGLDLNSGLIANSTQTALITAAFKSIYNKLAFDDSGKLILASAALMPNNRRPSYKIVEKEGKPTMVAEVIYPSSMLSDKDVNIIKIKNTRRDFKAALEKLNAKETRTDEEVSKVEYFTKMLRNTAKYDNIDYPTTVGFRTPATGLHSMVHMEIIDVHEEKAKTLFIPNELLILSGADLDVDSLNLLSPQTVKGKVVGLSDTGFDFKADISKFNSAQKEAYYKNVIYYTFKSTIAEIGTYVTDEDGNRTIKINSVGKHMLNPISTDYVTNVANSVNPEGSITNILLPDSKFTMHGVVSVGRQGVGTFANVAKLKAYLAGQKLTSPIVFKINGKTKTYSEVTNESSLENIEENNILVIDAFINSAIDNLKELKLGELDINVDNISTVSALLLLGEHDVQFIYDFIHKHGIDKKSLAMVVTEKMGLKKMPTRAALVKAISDRLDAGNDDDTTMLMKLRLLEIDSLSVISMLSIIRDSLVEIEDLTDLQKSINEITAYGLSKRYNTFNATFWNDLLKKNPHIKELVELSSFVNEVVSDTFLITKSYEDLLDALLGKTGISVENDSAVRKFINDYYLVSNIDTNVKIGDEVIKYDANSYINYIIGEFRDYKADEDNLGLPILDKLIYSKSRGGNRIKSLLSRMSANELLFYQAQFAELDPSMKTLLLKYLILSSDYKVSDTSFASLFTKEDYLTLPITPEGKSFITLMDEYSKRVNNEEVRNSYLEHMRLALFSQTLNFRGRDRVFEDFVSRNRAEVGDIVSVNGNIGTVMSIDPDTRLYTVKINELLINSIKAQDIKRVEERDNVDNEEDDETDYVEESIKGVPKVEKINGKNVFFDLKTKLEFTTKEGEVVQRASYKDAVAKIEGDNKLSSEKKEQALNKLLDTYLTDFRIKSGTMYKKVYTDRANKTAYYQKVQYFSYYENPVSNYSTDEYFNAFIPTVVSDSNPEQLSLPAYPNEVNEVFVVTSVDTSRINRTLYTRKAGTSLFIKDNAPKQVASSKSIIQDDSNPLSETTSMSNILEKMSGSTNTREEAVDKNLRSQYEATIGQYGEFKHKGITFTNIEDLIEYNLRNIEEGKIRGKYAEAMTFKHVFNLNVEPSEILKEIDNLRDFNAGFKFKINHYAKLNIEKSFSWLTDKDNVTALKKKIGFEKGDTLVMLDSNGKIAPFTGKSLEEYNRSFNSDKLKLKGEFDVLILHKDGTLSLFDIKSTNLDNLDSTVLRRLSLLHGDVGGYVFTGKTIDKGFLQVGAYAMAILESNPDAKFRNISLLNIKSSSDLLVPYNRTAAPMPYVLKWMNAVYNRERGMQIPSNLLDSNAYDYSVNNEIPDVDQAGYEKALTEYRKALILNAEATRMHSEFRGKAYVNFRRNLIEAEERYKALISDSYMVNNSAGIDSFSMWIGSRSRFEDADIQLFNKEFERAQLAAIKEKEAAFTGLKAVLNPYLESKGVSKKVFTIGDLSFYKDLVERNNAGLFVLKDSNTLSAEGKALVDYMNNTYKYYMDYFNSDNACYGTNKYGSLQPMSSIQYQREVLEDNIGWYEGWMPKISKTFREFSYENGLAGIKETAKFLYDKHLTFTLERDFERLGRFDKMAIPIKYANESMNKEENMSFDLERQFDLFVSWASHKKNMEHVHALGAALAVKNETSNDPRLKNVSKWLNIQLKQLVQKVKEDDIVASNKSQITQGIRKLMYLAGSFTANMLLTFNYIGGIKNTASILMQYAKNNIRQIGIDNPKDDIMYDQKGFGTGLWNALGAIKSDIRGDNHKLMSMFRQFGFSVKYDPTRVNEHRYATSGYSAIGSQIGTFLYSVPEEITSMASLYASMKSIKIGNSNLYDLYDLDSNGQLVWKGPDRQTPSGNIIKGVSAEEITKMKYMTELTNGAYRKDEKSLLDYTILGSIFISFKRTLIGSLLNTFQGAHSSAALGNFSDRDGVVKWENVTHEGRWNVLAGLIRAQLGDKTRSSYKFSNLTKIQKQNLKQTGIDLLMWAAIAMLFAGMGGDDDDKWDKLTNIDGLNSVLQKTTKGLTIDSANYIFPMALFNNLSPASFNYIGNFGESTLRFASNLVAGEIIGMESAYDKNGRIKGGTQFYKLFPITKTLVGKSINEDTDDFWKDVLIPEN